MAYLKFNKAELVNLSYSLKREIISAKAGNHFREQDGGDLQHVHRYL